MMMNSSDLFVFIFLLLSDGCAYGCTFPSNVDIISLLLFFFIFIPLPLVLSFAQFSFSAAHVHVLHLFVF
jgi:hypothetical protein